MSAMASEDAIQSLRAGTFFSILDEKGTFSEEIKRLQGPIRACRGHLTRMYN